jgi:ATP-dependent Lon protease
LTATEPTTPLGDDSYEAPALLAEGAVLFPGMEASITVSDSKNVVAAAQAVKEHNLVVMIPSSGIGGAVGSIGTLVLLIRDISAARGGSNNGGAQWLSKGLWRVRIDQVTEESPYVRVRFRRAGEDDVPSIAATAAPEGGNDDIGSPAKKSSMMRTVFGQIDQFSALMPEIPREIINFLKSIETPGKLADMCAYSPFFSLEEKLDLLRTLDGEERLGKVSRLFEKQLSDLKLSTMRTKSISECPTCIELADKAFELGPNRSREIAREFLEHVNREHVDELLAVLADRYGPEFMRRRALK